MALAKESSACQHTYSKQFLCFIFKHTEVLQSFSCHWFLISLKDNKNEKKRQTPIVPLGGYIAVKKLTMKIITTCVVFVRSGTLVM